MFHLDQISKHKLKFALVICKNASKSASLLEAHIDFEKVLKKRPKVDEFCYSGVFGVADNEYDVQKSVEGTWGPLLPLCTSSSGNVVKFARKFILNRHSVVFGVADYESSTKKNPLCTWGSYSETADPFSENQRQIHLRSCSNLLLGGFRGR